MVSIWSELEISRAPDVHDGGYMSATLQTEIDALLKKAIKEKRLIEVVYQDKRRIVEPHDYGVHGGVVKLLAYQIAGASSGTLPNWRWMEISQMSDVRLLDRTFAGGRSIGSGKHHEWEKVFARVEPAKGDS